MPLKVPIAQDFPGGPVVEDRGRGLDQKISYSSLPLELIKEGPVAMGCQPFQVSLHPVYISLSRPKGYHETTCQL